MKSIRGLAVMLAAAVCVMAALPSVASAESDIAKIGSAKSYDTSITSLIAFAGSSAVRYAATVPEVAATGVLRLGHASMTSGVALLALTDTVLSMIPEPGVGSDHKTTVPNKASHAAYRARAGPAAVT